MKIETNFIGFTTIVFIKNIVINEYPAYRHRKRMTSPSQHCESVQSAMIEDDGDVNCYKIQNKYIERYTSSVFFSFNLLVDEQ